MVNGCYVKALFSLLGKCHWFETPCVLTYKKRKKYLLKVCIVANTMKLRSNVGEQGTLRESDLHPQRS